MISEVDIRDMKFGQIIQLHKQLEHDIQVLLNKFIESTSLIPSKIDFNCYDSIGSRPEVINVTVGVEL